MKRKSTIFPMLYLLLIVMIAATSPAHAQTAIGGTTPDGSAMLDVQSTSKGVLFPRMTTTERNAIASPATGLMIFNTTTGCLEINLGAGTASWQSIKCALGTVSAINCSCTNVRQVGSHLMPGVAASSRSVRIPYTGGNGYLYDGQTVTSTGVTGLTATLAPGSFVTGADSLTYTITGTGASSGLASFALNIGGQTCTLNVPVDCGAYVDACVWKIFSCYNLGAAGAITSADPFTPNWELNGEYYQWGYQAVAAPGPTDGTTPNDGTSSTFSGAYTWNSSAAADGSWTDSPNPMPNNPCPTGFRVPTKSQWEQVKNNNIMSDPPGANWVNGANNYTSGKFFGPGLFLPAAGNRGSATGSGGLFNRDFVGAYWSSTPNLSTTKAWSLIPESNGASILDLPRLDGFSVRCIEE